MGRGTGSCPWSPSWPRAAHVDVVPIDTRRSKRERTSFLDRRPPRKEAFLLGETEADLVQLLRIRACCPLVRQDCRRRPRTGG